MTTCSDLRPRWCSDHLPYRNQNCCLPLSQQRRLSPAGRDYPMTTVCKISGLNSTACSLVQSGFGLPLPSLPVDFTTDLLAKLWSGKTFPVYTESTYWVTLPNFMNFVQSRRSGFNLARADHLPITQPKANSNLLHKS